MNKPLLDTIVCPWTAQNPRHDHQLIFPLADGRLLLVWCEYYADRPSHVTRKPTDQSTGFGDEAPCRISAKISDDGCRTWTDPFVLQDNIWQQNVKHPNLLRLPDGDVLFTFSAWDDDAQRNIYMRRSSDDCETWSPIEQISEPGWYCTNHDRIMQLSSGRILLPAHGVCGGGPYKGRDSTLCSWVWYSDDGFRTWKKSAEMTAPGRGAHEPCLVERKDGSLLVILRTTTTRLYQAISSDGGETWSTPEPTEHEAPDSEPLIRRIPSTGDLLLVWNNVASERNWPRTPLTAAVSQDEGATWIHKQNIDEREGFDAAYPAVFFQDDEVVVTYYSRDRENWARDSEVTMRIYRVDDFYAS